MMYQIASKSRIRRHENARHKLCLHHGSDLVITLGALTQERVDFVDEDDARLYLAREAEQAGDELVRLAIPLVSENRHGNIDKCRARLLCERLRKHCLPAPGRTVEQHTLWRGTESRGCVEEGGVEQREND